MEVKKIFEKWNKEEDVYARECGCPYRFKPSNNNNTRSRKIALTNYYNPTYFPKMAVHTPRDFWRQLDRQLSLEQDEPDYFKRGTTLRSSCNSIPRTEIQPLSPYLHGPVWGSIYCTMRDRSRGRGRSASLSRGTIISSQHQSPRSTSLSTTERSHERTSRSKMAQNGTILASEAPQTKYTAPKRYETTCYFMPLAVPVWYSTSVSLKINSTKRHYKESVNYQKKLVPYRFVETMTTETNRDAPPVLYVSEVNIDSQVPPKEHYMSLEAQQKAALSKPFSSNHQIQVESHS